ncbi:MAG TPA: VOC family protein [Chloroflexota bacterium]
MATSVQIVIDCADPESLASFWAEALGYKVQDPPPGYTRWEDWLREHGIPEERWNAASAVVDPDGKGPRFFFQRVPEQKTAKNRMHVDLNVSKKREVGEEEGRRRVDSEVDRLVSLGATRVGANDQHGEYWVVMQDPEGNEFCVQ